ncbi:unnamed protein product [Sphagnum jensenii]|uniref:Uncharacterized protein n=1 Tax=Sphagnum jensenii TaxID=128206 RepID=A0ABP0VJ38_9BRYO
MESSNSNRKKTSKSSARICGNAPSRTQDNLSRSSTQNEHAQCRAIRPDLSEAGSENQSRRTPSTDNEIVHHMNRTKIEEGDNPANRQSRAQSSAPDVSHQSSSSSSGAVRPQSARTDRTSDAAAIARGKSVGPCGLAGGQVMILECEAR